MLDVYQRFFGDLLAQQDEIRDLLRDDVPRFHGLLMRQPDFDWSEVRFHDHHLLAGQAWLADVAKRYERYLRNVFHTRSNRRSAIRSKNFFCTRRCYGRRIGGPLRY